MPIKATIKSVKPFNYKKVESKYIANANRFVDRLATYMARQSKESMQRTPISPATNRSRAGNPPAIDSSTLINSVMPKHVSDGVAKVYTNTEYAEELETKWDRYFLSAKSIAFRNTVKRAKAEQKNVGKV